MPPTTLNSEEPLNSPYVASTWANTHLKQYAEKLVRPLTI